MTTIEWTRGDDGSDGKTWNPTRGCSRVSTGCGDATGGGCYAMRQAHRFSGPGKPYEGLTTLRRGKVDWSGLVRFVPEMLGAPLRWRKPARVFVNSMSDLFHEALSNEDIAAVFGVMAAAPRHTFIVLTKRPQRMRGWFEWIEREDTRRTLVAPLRALHAPGVVCQLQAAEAHPGTIRLGSVDARGWPLPNVILGVSVENQETADERIPLLLATPAAVRAVSAEPLLGPVDLARFLTPCGHPSWTGDEGPVAQLGRWPQRWQCDGCGVVHLAPEHETAPPTPGIDWLIAGGESGSGARECDVEWIRSIAQQCSAAGVACFVKQLGATFALQQPDWGTASRVDRKGGVLHEWPEDLRVRQWPEVRR